MVAAKFGVLLVHWLTTSQLNLVILGRQISKLSHVPSVEAMMPSKTPKQRRTMGAAAHNAGFANKMGISQSVAREFNRADTRTATPSSITRMRDYGRSIKKR